MRAELWLLVSLGVAGLVFFFWKFNDSFPSASIGLKYSRAQITAQSRQWSRRIGYDPSHAIESTVFSPDDDARTFLEYELGQGQANKLMSDEIPVWNWVTRFCRVFELEECSVGLGPDGSLHYFQHSLPNDAPGKTIDHGAAQALAEKFLQEELKLSLAQDKLIKSADTKQLHRTDHYFTWEDQAHDYKGGRIRTYVYIAGDRVTEFSRTLHVPQAFEHKFGTIRSYNLLLKRISEIVFTILSSAVLFIFVWAFSSGYVRWRFVSIACAIAALLAVLDWVDATPTLVSGYQTTMSFQQYLVNSLLTGGLRVFASVVSCAIFIGALEPIYRMAFPEKIALEKLFTPTGLRSPVVFQSLVAGLSVFGIHTAYVVAFYLMGQNLGFWSPLEIRDASLLSNLWPVFSSINIGVNASMMEELMYRVLAMVIFRRLTGNFWIANFLQAAAWAFMHSDYPQEPAYVRGVELTIGGFFYGYILRTYGLLACVLGHFTYDAFIGVTPLISSPSMAAKLTSVLAVLPGVIVLLASLWLIRRRGALTDSSELTNASIPSVHRTSTLGPEPDHHFAYQPLSRKSIVACLVGGLIGAVLLFGLPLRTIGERQVLSVSRADAINVARRYLQQDGIDTAGMMQTAATTDETDDEEMQYVFEKAGYDQTKELEKAKEPRLVWKVRFFKPLNPNEYYVTVSPSGKPLYKSIVEDENEPGARPAIDEMSSKVESFLKENCPEVEPAVAVDSTKQERKARTDYSFTFRVPRLKVAEAEYNVIVGTVGARLSGLSAGWDVPQSWLFERRKVKPLDQVVYVLRIVVGVAAALLILWWLVGTLRGAHVRWKTPIALGCASAVILIASRMNMLPSYGWYYDTDVAFGTFVSSQLVKGLITVLSGTAATAFFSALAIAAYAKTFPDQPLISIVRTAWPHISKISASTRRMWLDAIVIGAGFGLIIVGVDHVFDWLTYAVSPTVRMLSLSAISGVADQWSPAVSSVLSALSAGLAGATAVPVAVSLARRYCGNSLWKLVAIGLVADLIGNTYLRYWQDYVLTVAACAALGALLYILINRVARFNLLAYAMMAYFLTLASTASTLIEFEKFDLYFPQVAVLVLALSAPVVYTGWLYLAPRRELDVMPPDKVA